MVLKPVARSVLWLVAAVLPAAGALAEDAELVGSGSLKLDHQPKCSNLVLPTILPTGKTITPTAAPCSTFEQLKTGLRSDGTADANSAVAATLSPDGKTLLVLTSGYNQGFKNETTGEPFSYAVLDPITGKPTETKVEKSEWVFVYEVGSGTPSKRQQISIPNTFVGLAWAPDGERFYVSGGIDDRVLVYRRTAGEFAPDAPFILLQHNSEQTAPLPKYDGGLLKNTPAKLATTGAVVAGMALSGDGKTLVAANFENDSISIVNTETRQVVKEVEFFKPGQSEATGEYPFDIAILSDKNTGVGLKAFVTSQRDNEVMVVDLQSFAVSSIAVGVLPTHLLLSTDGRQLFVANSESDSISVIDTAQGRVLRTIALARKNYPYTGSMPNAMALSPDGGTLYVTLAGENAVALVDLKNDRVVGRIPTAWYPNAVVASQDGKTLYVVNAKSLPGPNPSGGRTTDAGQAENQTFRNDYVLALIKSGITTVPLPGSGDLNKLSQLVDHNNGFDKWRQTDPVMKKLAKNIEHVLYIIKENRTYDQVLGDLPLGNGDPALTLFPEAVSPNHHQLAKDFVVLDNFYVSGSVSGDGWGWSTFARTTDYTEKTVPVLYGNAGWNGLTYDYEGNNRFMMLSLPQEPPAGQTPHPLNTRLTTVLDPTGQSSILPGPRDMSAPAGNSEIEPKDSGGYLWDSVLRAGKTVRAYGVLMDLSDVYYATSGDPFKLDPNNPLYIPLSATPFADQIPQAVASKVSLEGRTDLYFRGYDQKYTDIWSFNEWKRDLEAYIAQHGTMPNLMVMALDHDHFGSFSQAAAGVNTPELQMADNDYALGRIVEYLSQRPEWAKTAIFVLEDDAQNGPDHVDAQRTVAYIISPYTRKGGVVVSTHYNTVSMIRTMVDLLGVDYLGMNDANAEAMSDAFKLRPDLTPYTAIVPGSLCNSPVDTQLLLGANNACDDPAAKRSVVVKPLRDAAWWAEAMEDFDFEEIDHLGDPEAFNRVLWAGIKGENVPYPSQRSKANLRDNREQLLAKSP